MLRIGLLIACGVFALDQASKAFVLQILELSPPGCRHLQMGCKFIELSTVFDLRMVWNQGVAFGLLRAGSELERWALVALQAGIATVFLLWLRKAERPLTAIACGLIVGGGLGNMVDRILFGAVADFLDFNGLWFPWVLNVADAAINIGPALLILDFLLQGEKKAGPAPASAPQNGHDRTGA